MLSDWGDLQTLLAIANSGSLSAAARQLGTSQSTISRRLQAIERKLDRQIFVRAAGGVLSTTDAGAAVVAAADRMRSAFEEAAGYLSGLEAPLRVATCEVMARSMVVPMLASWASLRGEPADLAVHDDLFCLPDDAFDVLVTPLESAPDDMVGQRVAALQWGLFASPAYLQEHPLQTGQAGLDGHLVVRSSGSLADIAACRWFDSLGGRAILKSSSPAAQLDAAAAGAGIALLPRIIAGSDARLVELDFPGTPTSDVWMAARRAAAARPKTAAFLKWARGYFAGRSSGDGRRG